MCGRESKSRVCRCREALFRVCLRVCVCVCATVRPTYSVIGEQLGEAKQVVLDCVVKIWVKTRSIAIILTLEALLLWMDFTDGGKPHCMIQVCVCVQCTCLCLHFCVDTLVYKMLLAVHSFILFVLTT